MLIRSRDCLKTTIDAIDELSTSEPEVLEHSPAIYFFLLRAY